MTEKLTNIIAMALFGVAIILADVITAPSWEVIGLGVLLIILAVVLFILDKKGLAFTLVNVNECTCCKEAATKKVAKKTTKKTTTKKAAKK